MKNKVKLTKILLAIFLFVTIVIISIYIQVERFERNEVDESSSKMYENLGIDHSKLNIFFLDVGQADSTLITMNGQTMLIDGGNVSDGSYIVEFLKSQNITRIDYIVGTHVEEDHVGGLGKIIDALDVGIIYMPESVVNKKFYLEMQESMRRNNVQISKLEALEEITRLLGNATWRMLNVDNSDASEALNETSIVVELTYGDTKYLFMGDISAKVEKSKTWEKVDVLKVAHHGSKTGTSLNFLQQTNPTYAIISAGKNNRYNHPDYEVLERLKEKNLKEENIFITKEHGTIWMKSDGNSIEITKLQDFNLDGANRKITIMSLWRIGISYLERSDISHHLAIEDKNSLAA